MASDCLIKIRKAKTICVEDVDSVDLYEQPVESVLVEAILDSLLEHVGSQADLLIAHDMRRKDVTSRRSPEAGDGRSSGLHLAIAIDGTRCSLRDATGSTVRRQKANSDGSTERRRSRSKVRTPGPESTRRQLTSEVLQEAAQMLWRTRRGCTAGNGG